MFATAALSSIQTIVNKYLQDNKGVNWNGLTVDDFVVVACVAGSVVEAGVDDSAVEGRSSPVVKISDHGRHVMSSIPVPLKTRRVGQRGTLNLSRTQTFSHWCVMVVRRKVESSFVVHITWPWFKTIWSVTKSPRVAEQCDVNIHSLTL
ncbi:uncharacterized protein TNCV_1061261 [Trichonephila clavipes]|nr:uncharacterized protein TNCV_1061261 [Trichonephila clavipes]